MTMYQCTTGGLLWGEAVSALEPSIPWTIFSSLAMAMGMRMGMGRCVLYDAY